jgi:hypothetical protein
MSSSPQNESHDSLNKQHRLEASATILSDIAGLKTALFELFGSLGIGARIGPHTYNETPIRFEGAPNLVMRAKKKLEETLIDKCPGVEAIWKETKDSTEILLNVTIIETPVEFKRSKSSGDFKEIPIKELSLGASAETEFVKQQIESAFARFAPLGRLVGLSAPEKHVTIEHLGSPATASVKLHS